MGDPLANLYNSRYLAAQAKMREIADAPRLQRVSRSRFSELVANAATDLREKYGFDEDLQKCADVLKRDWHVFVVGHDYAKAFEGAGEIDLKLNQVRMPYEQTVWEFCLNGVSCCVCVGEYLEPWFCFDGGWLPLVGIFDRFFEQQISAVCIALDAEIAEDIVVKPPRANSAVRRGIAAPKNAYHTITLKGRTSRRGTRGRQPSQGLVRLHFRRGHWRHIDPHNQESRTWVKWTLVGNPDLGFIDKHYRL